MLTPFEVEVLWKSVLGAALGFIVGWQREAIASPAGERTMALLCMGVAAITGVGAQFLTLGGGVDRLIGGVVTGVGFLGAGVILRTQEGHIRGVTTAASIWAVTAVGIVVGAGHAVLGVLLTALVLLLLAWQRIPGLRLLSYKYRTNHQPSGADDTDGDDEHASDAHAHDQPDAGRDSALVPKGERS